MCVYMYVCVRVVDVCCVGVQAVFTSKCVQWYSVCMYACVERCWVNVLCPYVEGLTTSIACVDMNMVRGWGE